MLSEKADGKLMKYEARSKADLMRRLRAERKEKGLVEFRDWLIPEHREQVKRYVERLKRASK